MRLFSPVIFLSTLLAPALFAQQEVALTIGALTGPVRTTTAGPTLSFSTGVALQANYSRYLKSYKYADLYGDVHLLVSPRQSIDSTLTSATRHYAAFYATPGVRVKFYPKKLLSPWVVAGGGYALYLQSDKTIAGTTNAAPSTRSTGALEFGGGLDYVLTPRMTFRAEVRDFYTGSPNFNTPVHGKGQFNFVVGGGIVFHLGQ